MNKKNQSIKILSTLLIMMMAVNAEAKVHERGAYLEGNVGTLYASVNLFGIEFSQFGSFGINTNGGYQYSRYFATELGYTNYGLGLNNIDAAAKFILPFGDGMNDYTVFAKVGPAFLFQGNNQGFLPLLGVGGSYSMNDHLDANIQAQGVTAGFFSLGLVSAGLTYHFD